VDKWYGRVTGPLWQPLGIRAIGEADVGWASTARLAGDVCGWEVALSRSDLFGRAWPSAVGTGQWYGAAVAEWQAHAVGHGA
jgi:hypothetical protein